MRLTRFATGLVFCLLASWGGQAASAQDAASTTGGNTQPAAPAGQQPPQPAWSTSCTGAARTAVADCVIEQRVYLSQTGQLFGAMTIRVPADTRDPVMMLQLPLGLFLPAGATVAVDGANSESLPIQTCEASGCYVGGPLSDALLAAMKKGNQLGVTFQNVQKKSITMPISLNGFTAAFASIQ